MHRYEISSRDYLEKQFGLCVQILTWHLDYARDYTDNTKMQWLDLNITENNIRHHLL